MSLPRKLYIFVFDCFVETETYPCKSRLNKVNVEYREKLVEIETQAKLGDSEVVPLRYQVQRMKTEIDSMSSHSKWLEAELKSKDEQLANVRSTHASDISQVRRDLDSITLQKDELEGETSTLKRQLQQVQSRMERTSEELREARQEASDKALEAEQEMIASQRLVALQKEQMQRLQQRHDSMAGQMESLKQLAAEAEQESSRELVAKEREFEERSKVILQEQAEDYKQQLEALKEQVEDANRRCKQAEDGILATNVPRLSNTPHRPFAISDKPAAAAGAVENEEPLNLTELYSRLAEAEDQLAAETLRRKKAEIQVARIMADIEAKAPELIRQRKEFEMAIENQEEYKKRLYAALEEAQSSRAESSELQSEMGRLQKRNKELEDDTAELAKQVQSLLVSRSSSALGAEDTSQIPASVVQMQNTNQRLLKEHRLLTAKIADLEGKLQHDTLRSKVDTYEKELGTLREDRKRQEILVESIVQQRDLYRALLNKQDSNLLGSQADEASALTIVRQQAERTKTLEEERNNLAKDLATARADLGAANRDKEVALERVARYEALNEELSSTADRLQTQLSTAKADVARSEADSAFHKEKSLRMEENLERSKEEVARILSSKGDLQRINQGLQEAVSKATTDCSKMESELSQAKMKLRLAEAHAESAKKAEERMSNESTQLRSEISRQGALIESIQRIESRLSAKTVADEEASKAQVSSLSEKLSVQESKHLAEIEKLNNAAADQNVKIQETEKEREKAVREALESKRDLLKASAELQQLKKHSQTIETQLKLAKKKLGDTEDGDDAEAELRNKVLSLTNDLEASRKEVSSLKERADTFSQLAKDNEEALAELTEATNSAKTAQEQEVKTLKSHLETAQSEVAKTKEIVSELTNDLSLQREEREKAVQEVKGKISGMEAEVSKYKKDAEAAESRYSQLQAEVLVLRTDASNAQNNYERELALHATARTDLRAAKEEVDTEARLRRVAEEQVGGLKSELMEQSSLFDQEKASIESNFKELEKNLKDTRAQNALLHSQLEKIGDQIESLQGGKNVEESVAAAEGSTDEFLTLQRTISELREVVKFVRSEKEMVQAQLDSARRTAERERAASALAKRSLDEARAELKIVQESSQGDGSGIAIDVDGLKEKLQSAEEQSRLLGDSNAHLRQEMKKLETKFATTQEELDNAKKAALPTEKRQQELEADKAGLLAEKESLLREINDWKGRVQSLVTKFNQVDPVEHDKVLAKAETLEKELKVMETQKQDAEAESKRIRVLTGRVSKELQQNKQLAEKYKKSLEKVTSEKEELVKASKNTTSKKELDEMKEKLKQLEREKAAEKAKGAMNDKLRERLRQFQKTIVEHKKNETLLTNQLKEAKEKLKAQETQEKSEASDQTVQSKTEGESNKKETIEDVEKTKPDPKKEKPVPSKAEPSSEGQSAAKKPEKAVEKKQLPMVPPGGFKYGPSNPVKVAAAETKDRPPQEGQSGAQEKPTPSLASKPVASQISKKRPAETSEGNQNKKKPALETTREKAAETVQSAGEQAVGEEKPSESTAKSSGPNTIVRRDSGVKKEMSMKEKLLEKKRKLMEKMKEKEAKLKKSQEAQPEEPKEIKSDEEPAAKRQKSDAPKEDVPEKVDVSETAGQEAPASEESKTSPSEVATEAKADSKETSQDEEGDAEVSVGEQAGEASKEEPADTAAATTNKSANSSSSEAVTPAFGSGSTTTFGFGASSSAAAPTFGQASAFGSGFGSGSTAPSVFGSGASVFGTKTESSTPSTSAFGGAFLNMKPPGSSTSPPQFSFGSSKSITLPTPTISTQPSMFSAFSASKSLSSGGVAAKPLFGSTKKESQEALVGTTTKEAQEEPKDDDEEEDGEMKDSETT